MDEKLPDFTGKTVVFYVKTTAGTPGWIGEGLALVSPYFQNEAGRLCLKGRTPPTKDGKNYWYEDRDASISWDSVFYYIAVPSDEYDSYEGNESESVETACKVPTNKKQESKPFVKISLGLIGLVIPFAILIAIIVWIVKMLSN